MGASSLVSADWGFPVIFLILEINLHFYFSAFCIYLNLFVGIEFMFRVETSAFSCRNFDHISALRFRNLSSCTRLVKDSGRLFDTLCHCVSPVGVPFF